jgi:hypothetical protein
MHLRGQRCCTFTTWTGEARNTPLDAACSPLRLAGISRISVSYQSFLSRDGLKSVKHPSHHGWICQRRVVAILKAAHNVGRQSQLTRELVDTHPERQPARAKLFRCHGLDRVTQRFYASSLEAIGTPVRMARSFGTTYQTT